MTSTMTSVSVPSVTFQPFQMEGTGLITGLPVSVRVEAGPVGSGIVFWLDEQTAIPARLPSVVNTNRGVTLAHPSKKFLSIVEHFLCAASLAGVTDAAVHVTGAPELPILDGSAAQWLAAFEQAMGHPAETPEADIALKGAVFLRPTDEICLYALPADHFAITYAVDFDHPDMACRWTRWDARTDGPDTFAPARTFGYLRELPVLQAQGLAKGVSLENTLGLTDDGGYTTPLRFDEEPTRHKLIDLIGDLTLMGINPLRLKAHIFAVNAGHESHVAFASRLQQSLIR
jgi:UDP-3-O-[3-hydroxymyristoyl] N-acetylglucosamine deacetylase